MTVFRLFCAAFLLTAAAARAQPMPPPLADLAARVMPAVVSIASTDPITGGQNPGDDGNNDDNGDNGDGSAYHPTADNAGTLTPPPKAVEALGAGFVIDPAGYIATNNHVIDGAASVTVTFQDGTVLPAIIVGRDKDADLALLKVDAGHPLPSVSFGDSSRLQVGDWVLAIGNPFGLPGSTSAGIVSALHRNINAGTYDDFIQTDAPINHGNSGGPLFNMEGQVVGINSAIYSPSGGSVGVGFAIPSAMVAPVMLALKTTGAMTRGWLGLATEEVTPDIQQTLGLPSGNGALVGGVYPNSPAAGILQPGDVITALGGAAITDPRVLLVRTGEFAAGANVPIRFWRDGDAERASLLITVPPPDADNSENSPAPSGPGNLNLVSLGLSLSATPDDAGVKVTAATGPAAQAGILAGNIISEVAGQTVTTAADVQSDITAITKAHQPEAVFLINGDEKDGTNPGPRWVPVRFKVK